MRFPALFVGAIGIAARPLDPHMPDNDRVPLHSVRAVAGLPEMLRIALPCLIVALAACSKPAEQSQSVPESVAGTNAVVVGSAAAEPGAGTALARASRYSNIKTCTVVELNEDEDWSVSRCPGEAGYTVMLNYGDARDNLELRRAGTKPVALNLSGLAGGGFNTVGETLEWRGAGDDAAFAPTALIVRNNAVQDPEQPERPTSLLVVVDLVQGCVVAQVKPQAKQNEAARAIADGPRRPCQQAG